ncbi:MBL fold metallo-hydrolase [Ruegeria pomeroyi]|nr:MBL fold metallo-hydrolase [Ruegeria pomeroyi]
MVPVDSVRSGPWRVDCLVDGGMTFGTDVFANVAPARQAELLGAAGLSAAVTEFNAYLMRHDDGRIWLVDTGCGSICGPEGGQLPDRLASAGIAPGEISRVILTHLHADHCGGLLGPGAALFADAEILLHPDEVAHWRDTEAPGAQVLKTCADRLRLIGSDADLGADVRVWALPGHTPGHFGLRIGDDLVLAGDIVHSEALQLPDPENATQFDVDPAQALASRRAALAEIAERNLVWSGSHLIGAKFARLDRAGDGFAKLEI